MAIRSPSSTIGYWQELTDNIPSRFSATPPYRYGYPIRLPCNRVLVLPLRRLPDSHHAVASLIANQASHSVVASLSEHMAFQAKLLGAELIVGLPTLGLSFAALVAEEIGQSRFVPLGYSRKFWYDDALSEPVRSITSPEAGKRLRLDPHLLPLLRAGAWSLSTIQFLPVPRWLLRYDYCRLWMLRLPVSSSQ